MGRPALPRFPEILVVDDEAAIRGGSTVAYLRTLSIDEALVRMDAVDTAYYLGEALGSSVALTTPGSTAATTYTYEPFGRTEASGTLNANPFRFTGREDDGTGLYYYRARCSDPIPFARSPRDLRLVLANP